MTCLDPDILSSTRALCKCRSLTFDQRGDVPRLDPPLARQFPELAAMTDLTHLKLECRMSVDGKSDPLVEALRGLSGLRELTLTRCKEMRRLTVPAKAELTKLVVDSSALEVSGCAILSFQHLSCCVQLFYLLPPSHAAFARPALTNGGGANMNPN